MRVSIPDGASLHEGGAWKSRGAGCPAPRQSAIGAPLEATWRSGDAADCKSAYPGSIPGVASSLRARSERRRPYAVAMDRHSPKGEGGLCAANFDSANLEVIVGQPQAPPTSSMV